ncbi:MAG TPA: ABC transporter permease [Anaerolineaceae bacterium]|uniref:Putative ABC transporter permease protein n=1 Tax=Anaerolinea thermophila TaxID=167964 RepID=A0A117LH30_9CHLR|nr:MAG: Putative ABC transporter permease protein [Anaerolinea thermophila]HAF61720.1 ABC transporter permease [Anaerolineaceae bacterium]
MNFAQILREAWNSLTSNKMRSVLTILGIVIGVAAVIAMLAIGSGAQDTILNQISGIGTNLLFIFEGNEMDGTTTTQPLTLQDAQAITELFAAPHVDVVAPVIQSSGVVKYSGESKSTQIFGITPEYQDARNYELLEGEFVNEQNVNGRASVALIGVDVADKLFGQRDNLLGETIHIEGQPFRIIGVLAPKGGGQFGSQDDVILVPMTTAKSRLMNRDQNRVDIIYVKAISADSVPEATSEIEEILRKRHRTDLGENDFTIYSQQDFLSLASSITNIFTVLLGGIAGISLLVGGIGIMNIMLVSVTERTKEIGLRKAIGAKKKDILIQFLTESSLLSFMGGIMGIILGWILSSAIGSVASAQGVILEPQVGLEAIFLATIFSSAVGLFFGIYPANKAANLEPVEALRHE